VSALVRSIGLAIVVCLTLAGCMTSHDVIAVKPWALHSIDGKLAAGSANLTLGTDGQLTAKPGCNTTAGTFVIEGNRIRTGLLATSLVLCADPAVAAQETTFLAVLDADPAFAVDTGTGQLRLTAGGMTLLFDPE
jgi:heat shock protein HslJ